MASTSVLPRNLSADSTLDKIRSNPHSNPSQISTLSSSLKQSDFENGLMGLIAFLPKQHEVPGDSCAHFQEALNPGAFKHPCVVMAISHCRRLAFCAPMKSFHGQTFENKWRFCGEAKYGEISQRWLGLKHQNGGRHNELPILTHSGPDMPKVSYVELQNGFWIEWNYLTSFNEPGSMSVERRLTPASLQELRSHHIQLDNIKFLTPSSPPPSPRSQPIMAASFSSWPNGQQASIVPSWRHQNAPPTPPRTPSPAKQPSPPPPPSPPQSGRARHASIMAKSSWRRG